MRPRCRTLIVALTPLLVAGPLAAQPDPAVQRPTVALVLSGGGARGLAHLGVLEVLDELRIPIDFIVGTSMGAIVGGVYATGMPADELIDRFRAQDWTAVFRDRPDRRELRLRQKRDDRTLTLPIELGLDREGLHTPRGLVAGAYLNSLLDVHTWTAFDIRDFDDLPIPFRAVATDVDSGEPVVLSRGSLPAALRASMAVPAVFPPVTIDDRVLVDGGVVENLPLRVALEMGADVAIAVDLSTGLDDISDGESILSISQRVLVIFMTRNTQAQLRLLRPQDILVTPELNGISTTSFTMIEDAIRAGEQATRAVSDRLRPLSLPEPQYRALVEERARAWRNATTFTPAFVRIDTTGTLLSPGVVAASTRLRAGQPIDVFTLPDEVRAILGYGGFDRVEIGIAENAGAQGLAIRPFDRSWGPGVVRAGLALFDRQRGDAGFDLTLHYTHGRFTAAGAQIRAAIRLGSAQGAMVELYQPLDAGEHWFTAADVSVERRDALLPGETGTNADVEFADLALTALAGRRLGTSGELRAGVRRGILRVERPAAPGGGTVERADIFSFLAELEIDRLDRVAFPRTGELILAEIQLARETLGGEQAFERAAIDAIAYRSFGRHTLAVGAFAGSALGGTLPTVERFTLGGLFRLTGVQPSAVQGSYAGLARTMYRLTPGGPDGGLHLGASVEGGAAWESSGAIDISDVRLSASVFVGLDTPLGPLHLAYGFTRGVDPGWLLRFGTVF